MLAGRLMFGRVVCALLITGTVAGAQIRARAELAVPAPSVTATLTSAGAQVSWTAVGGARQYVVLRAANAKSAAAPVGVVAANTLSFADRGAAAGMVYQVVAVFADGRKGTSAPVAVVSPATTPTERVPVRAGGAVAGAVGANAAVNAAMPSHVTSFAPTKGVAGMAAKVTIYGAGFKRGSTTNVKFTGPSGQTDQPASVIAVTDGAIDVKVPAGARTGKVFVETGTGSDLYGSYSPGAFTVAPNIEVTRFSPDGGARGSSVTVYGRNFAVWDKIQVRFSVLTGPTVAPQDMVPVTASNVTDGSFTVVVPKIAIPGVLQVIATFADVNQGSSFVQTTTPFNVVIPFTIAGFSPDRARQKTAATPGVTVGPPDPATTISGTGFMKQAQFAVYFTGATGAQDQLASNWNVRDDEAMVLVPAGARTGKVKIVSGTGAAAESAVSSSVFTVMDPVRITGIAPASAVRGDKVHVTGSGFLHRSVLAMQFNNGGGTINQSGSISAKTDTSFDVIVPPSAGNGAFSVTSGVGTDFETVTSGMSFSVAATPLSIESVSPLLGAPGQQVQITGYGYANPIVNFANGQRAVISSVAPGAMTPKGQLGVITTTVPQGAVTGSVTVLTADGSVSSNDVFTIPTFKPVVTDFQPKAGIVGTVITLTGTFDPVAANNAVIFNGWGTTAVTTHASTSTGTSITVVVPAGAHTGTLSIPSPLGNAGLVKAFFLPPVITGFTLAAAPAGYDITILGDNFFPDPSTVVKFNGVAATNVTVFSNTRINVTVPAGATTGSVTVLTPGGTATSPTPFTVR